MKNIRSFIHSTQLAPIALLLSVAVLSTACTGIGSAPDPALLTGQRIAAVVNSPDRSAADQANDLRRKPVQMLTFIGIKPGSVAMDLSSGGGYTTELLARSVGPAGRVYGQNAPRDAGNMPRPPAAPEGDSSPTAAARPNPMQPPAAAVPRQTLVSRAANPALGNIVPVSRKFEDPMPAEVANASLDLVTLMFNYHDLGHLGVDRSAMNKAVFTALKPGGFYVIADHAGRPGTGISEAGTLHRIEEAFLRHEVEMAGFRFVAEGNFLRNPSDPRDKNTPEPPQPKDEFVLKFVKP